jgi:negative regulator of flagellin synthesis FlgM
MKINSNNPIDGKDLFNKVNELNKKKDAEKKSGQVEKQSSGQDKISLSGRAQEITDLKAMIDQLPEVRSEKVEAVKKTIDAGNYHVDSRKVAEKMLEEL